MDVLRDAWPWLAFSEVICAELGIGGESVSERIGPAPRNQLAYWDTLDALDEACVTKSVLEIQA